MQVIFWLQALTTAFKCRSLDKEDLEGHCVKSLLKIVLAQTSQVKMLSDVVDYIL
jgi:hypothetical protein